MGKGKADRAPSNKARRRRKSRIRSFLNHISKHPNYWNEKNKIPFYVWQLIVIFYVLIVSMGYDSDSE